MNAALTYPAELGALVTQIRVQLDLVAAWPHAIQRHAALEDVGVLFARQLESASTEADVARALAREGDR